MMPSKASKKGLTLRPLAFEEAVTDLLRVKPRPKGKAKNRSIKKTKPRKPSKG
jgi:hypothetical protein